MARAGILNTPQTRRRSAESRIAAAMRRWREVASADATTGGPVPFLSSHRCVELYVHLSQPLSAVIVSSSAGPCIYLPTVRHPTTSALNLMVVKLRIVHRRAAARTQRMRRHEPVIQTQPRRRLFEQSLDDHFGQHNAVRHGQHKSIRTWLFESGRIKPPQSVEPRGDAHTCVTTLLDIVVSALPEEVILGELMEH